MSGISDIADISWIKTSATGDKIAIVEQCGLKARR
jgi:hypothetical protein